MLTTRKTYLKSSITGSALKSQKSLYNSRTNYDKYSVVVDDFDSAYWSGLDANIFFDEIFIDEIVNIQYQVSENVMPLYSWGDYAVRFVARGVKIVQGAFSINFKRSLYIPTILNTLKKEEAASYTTSNTTRRMNAVANPTTIEEILSMSKQSQTGKPDLEILNEIQARKAEKFWSSEDTSLKASSSTKNNPLYQTDTDGFTIYIKYGQPKIVDDQTSLYGSNGSGMTAKSVGTIEAIENVHISGSSKVIDDTGRPVLETYSFIGSNLISEVG